VEVVSTFLAWIVQGVPELLVDKTASEFVQRVGFLGALGGSGGGTFKIKKVF